MGSFGLGISHYTVDFWHWYLCAIWSCTGPPSNMLSPLKKNMPWHLCPGPVSLSWCFGFFFFQLLNTLINQMSWKCLGETDKLEKNWGVCMSYTQREEGKTVSAMNKIIVTSYSLFSVPTSAFSLSQTHHFSSSHSLYALLPHLFLPVPNFSFTITIHWIFLQLLESSSENFKEVSGSAPLLIGR